MERIGKPKVIQSKNDVIIDGNTNIMYSLAKCCMPVKGDDIIGFITKGEGVSIHKKNCPNVTDKDDRIIPVSWYNDSDSTYITMISLYVANQSFLVDLVNEAAKEKITIIEIKNKDMDNGTTLCNITIKVKDKEALDHFKRQLESFKNVEVKD